MFNEESSFGEPFHLCTTRIHVFMYDFGISLRSVLYGRLIRDLTKRGMFVDWNHNIYGV